MRNEELPAMPLLNKLNPYINLEGSNLCIHNELIKWQPVNGSRIAGVSSFGAGGAYAHVVLEEYKYPKIKSVEKAERLIILSAKKEESLKQYIKDLLEYLKSPLSKGQRENETWLRDISYSLMIGREQLNVRLAFCVDGIPGLIEKLKGVLNDSMEGYLFKKSTEDDLLTREEIRNENDLNQIARLWIEGNKISGEQISALYDGAYRISLPGYAFDEKSYWVELIPKRQEDVVCKDDFFISNHIVNDQKIMPGVAYLNYVIKAAKEKGIIVKGISNLCYISPLRIEDREIEVRVNILEDNNFTIDSWDGTKIQHHVQGMILTSHTITYSNLDDGIKELMYSITTDVFYEQLSKKGLFIGKSFQSVKELRYNKSEIMAQVELSEELDNTMDSFVLHPAVMDGVLQAVISRDNDSYLHVPFEIREMNIFDSLPRKVTVYGRKNEESGKWDIKVTDATNRMLLSINGLVSKSVRTDTLEQSNQEDWIVNVLTRLKNNELTVADVENML